MALLTDRPVGNGYVAKSEMARDTTEHAYEQICLRQEPETGGVAITGQKRLPENPADSRWVTYTSTR